MVVVIVAYIGKIWPFVDSLNKTANCQLKVSRIFSKIQETMYKNREFKLVYDTILVETSFELEIAQFGSTTAYLEFKINT